MSSYKDDMIRDINAVFNLFNDCDDISLHIKAEYHHDALFIAPIGQEENHLFHQIRAHKLSLCDQIAAETPVTEEGELWS